MAGIYRFRGERCRELQFSRPSKAPNLLPMRILVTGAGRAIGAATCTELSKAGHEVVATARDVSLLDELDVALRLLSLKRGFFSKFFHAAAERGPESGSKHFEEPAMFLESGLFTIAHHWGSFPAELFPPELPAPPTPSALPPPLAPPALLRPPPPPPALLPGLGLRTLSPLSPSLRPMR